MVLVSDLTGVNAGVGSTTIGFTTSSILEVPSYDFNSLYATIFVQDSVTKEINYNEVVVDFDGICGITKPTLIQRQN